MQRYGLRWRKAHARTLRNIADRCIAHGQSDVGLYFKAAESAEQGVPLEVHCNDKSEVDQMVALLVLLGAPAPSIDEMRHDR